MAAGWSLLAGYEMPFNTRPAYYGARGHPQCSRVVRYRPYGAGGGARPDAEKFVNHVVTYDVTQMKLMDAHYAIFCYADGGCVDDLFVYKLPDPQAQDGRPYFSWRSTLLTGKRTSPG